MRKKIKAFTLIELLVVISIIALLLSILVPTLGNARDQTRRILCASNLKTIGMGDIMYSQESDDWHVPAYYDDLTHDPAAPLWFQNLLFAELVDLKGRHDEGDRDIFEEEAQTPQLKDFKCPNDKRTVENGGLHIEQGHIVQGSSYAMNMMSIRPAGGGAWLPEIVYALETDQVVNPAEKIFFMDGQWFVVYDRGAAYKRIWDVYGDRMGAPEWDAASYRHDEGANIAFYDGHVAWMPKEQICPYMTSQSAQQEARNAIWLPVPGQEYLPLP